MTDHMTKQEVIQKLGAEADALEKMGPLSRVRLLRAAIALLKQSNDPQTEYSIAFDTKSFPGKLGVTVVRVGLGIFDLADAADMEFNMALCNHPLYGNLREYVKQNPGRVKIVPEAFDFSQPDTPGSKNDEAD